MKSFKKPSKYRMESDIQHLLTTLLQRDINDPCLLGTVITSVDVSRNNQSAVVKVHGMKRDDADLVAERLMNLSSHFEYELRRAMKRKRIPHLNFSWDHSLDQGNDMVELLNKLHRS
ncbi:MAG: 30S ribosome-binding factor RbfA [Mariprofundaceae bacterium]|nr:30S ribosome-binding factor RbfA [Mariprofundaceae bacterium]